jgi:hypothetical protein
MLMRSAPARLAHSPNLTRKTLRFLVFVSASFPRIFLDAVYKGDTKPELIRNQLLPQAGGKPLPVHRKGF